MMAAQLVSDVAMKGIEAALEKKTHTEYDHLVF